MIQQKINRFHQYLLFIVFVFISFVVAALMIVRPANAESIGVTPTLIDVQIEQGTETNYTFNLIRSEAVIETENYSVVVDGPIDQLIDLDADTLISFQPGDDKLEYSFSVNATDVPLGVYEGSMVFTRKMSHAEVGAGIDTEYGLGPAVKFEVVDDLPIVIDANKEPGALEKISMEDYVVDQTEYAVGDHAYVTWKFHNHHDLAVVNIPYEIRLDRNNEIIQTYDRLETAVVEPGDNIEETFQFEIPSAGEYRVSVFLDDEVKSEVFSVTSASTNSQKPWIVVVIASMLLLSVGFFVATKRRR